MAGTWKLWEGQTVAGTFQLRQYLGGSDHSAVFLTDRTGEESQKAVIKLTPATPESWTQQLSRVALAAKLSHPHLLQIFQTGQCRLGSTDLLYVVMEYADENLSQILPHRPLSPAETRQMLLPVLDALAYLHRSGFVHNHLKPANIMATEDQVKLSCDGICRTGESNVVTAVPSIYIAPEVASGGPVSPASDVWSLGVTLVEVLTQFPPALDHGPNGAVVPAMTPEPFLEIVNHCLVRDPKRRWSVAEIAACLQQDPVVKKGPAATVRRDQPKRTYILPAVAAGLLLVMLAGFRLSRPTHVRPDASTAPETSKTPSLPLVLPASQQRPSGMTRGTVLEQALPNVSQAARNTIQGKVKVSVRVDVDPSGSVVAARLTSPGPSKYFARLGLEAAQKWKFSPPQVDGQSVASQWTLRFEFGRTATNVQPAQATP